MIHLFQWWHRRKLLHKSDAPTRVQLRSPESISTPLGHIGFRVVHPDASLEMGIERARQTRCYLPRVEEAENG